MKIELKNIKHIPSMSQETEAFTASLYINDFKAGYAHNQGHGGNTSYGAENEEGSALISEAEAYCKKLPAKKYKGREGMKPFSVKMDLELFIDTLLDQHLEQKEIARLNKKMEKTMEKGIVFGQPGGKSFASITWTSNTIANLLSTPRGQELIANAIKKDVTAELKDGTKILNTNIPEKLYKEAGLQPSQYTGQKMQQAQVPKLTKKPGRKI